ncbi:MAG: sugar ABC transporter permease [Lachnospiraceae bacterium]|nr:sugar ABC transporter permease [Lachnospiraceae bacterium]
MGNPRKKKDTKFIFLLLGPFCLLHLIFTLIPAAFSFVLSFFKYRGYGEATFVGFSNYLNLLKMESTWRQMVNTMIYYVLHLIPCLIIGFAFAYIVYSMVGKRAQRIYKAVFYLPQLCATVAASLIFAVLFGTKVGVINQIFNVEIPWLTNLNYIKTPIIVLIIWRTLGWYFLILLSGMSTVSPDLIDAARLDGASRLQQIRYVILPIMKNIISFLIITETMSSIKIYTEPALLTSNITSTAIPIAAAPFVNVIVSNLEGGQFGMASAAGWLLFIVILIFTLLYMLLFNERGGVKE